MSYFEELYPCFRPEENCVRPRLSVLDGKTLKPVEHNKEFAIYDTEIGSQTQLKNTN